MVLEFVYAAGVIAASLVLYFGFVDKALDSALDRAFASWHTQNLEEIE